jgi:hypothetical protein
MASNQQGEFVISLPQFGCCTWRIAILRLHQADDEDIQHRISLATNLGPLFSMTLLSVKIKMAMDSDE